MPRPTSAFVQTETSVHPAAPDPRTLLENAITNNDVESLASNLAALLNTTERHTHQNYCEKGKKHKTSHDPLVAGDHADLRHNAPEPGHEENEKCRFEYPKPICNAGNIVVKLYSVQKKGETEKTHRVQLEIKSKRNDQWLNSHMEHLMPVWRANMDIQLTINLGKVVGYMTKYVTTSEAAMTKIAQRMICQILLNGIEERIPVNRILKTYG